MYSKPPKYSLFFCLILIGRYFGNVVVYVPLISDLHLSIDLSGS